MTLWILGISCSKFADDTVTVTVSNSSSINRKNETIQVAIKDLGQSFIANPSCIAVTNKKTNDTLSTQLVDVDGNHIIDAILFQSNIVANSKNEYLFQVQKTEISFPTVAFSRFVPERTDDYAWENDRVAFRTYGPSAQKIYENNTPGGTLSSGIDCWLKKVDYPIINKWYEKHTKGTGSYHEDTGEGLDNYHVGKSRGCGGLTFVTDSILHVSKNFTSYKTIDTGAIRTGFTLSYDKWMANDTEVSEKKYITLDKGSNLMKVNATVLNVDEITVGMTLHENDGSISSDTLKVWCNYFQPHASSTLNTAILCHPKYFKKIQIIESEKKDQSHALVHLKVIDEKVEYYTGFNWAESLQFASQQKWEQYLTEFSIRISEPLKITIQ